MFIDPEVEESDVELEFVTGRGGAGFHSPGPALTTGQGGYFGGNPRPAHSLDGPRFSPPLLMGTHLGHGRGRGQGQGTLKKHAPPRAVQRGGAGSWAGGPRFSGPWRPRNKHYVEQLSENEWSTPHTTPSHTCRSSSIFAAPKSLHPKVPLHMRLRSRTA